MADEGVGRSVRAEFQVRVPFSNATDLAGIFEAIQDRSVEIRALLALGETLRLVCDQPTEVAAALAESGLDADTETAVLVVTEEGDGALTHILRTLDVAEIEVRYSYSSAVSGWLHIVIGTANNPKAEDVLRNYLILQDRAN